MEEMDNTVKVPNAIEEQAAALTLVPAAAEKKLPVKKPAKRSFDELNEIALNKMTEAEKLEYIKELREERNKLSEQSHAYKENAEKAYEQYRFLNQQFSDFKIKATAKLNWAKQCIEHCRTAIILAGNVEE
jgi:Zn-dependent M32 family carboxypeptidase